MKIVVIGGVAAGPKTASRISRLNKDADITLIEKGKFLSYAGCGLPYYVSGVVKSQAELMSTPVGVVRDPIFFSKVKNIHVRNNTKAMKIDREKKTVLVKTKDGENEIPYDTLVLSTGSTPFVPDFPGKELDNVFTLQKVEDAENIKSLLEKKQALDIIIVGGGLIGIEMAEAFVHSHCRVTILERLPHILPMLDDEMAENVEKYLEAQGVKVRTNINVEAFLGNGHVHGVKTDKEEFKCDAVLVAVGVRPNAKLAKEAGLEIGKTGGIKVNSQMQTSDSSIYAVGDCAEQKDLITQKECYVPLGSTANKQGRVAANNICGKEDHFPGVLGSAVCKIFDYTIARTGLSEKQAKREGYDVLTVLSPAPDKPHFYPTAKPIFIKLIVDRATRKLLGMQSVGPGDAVMRCNSVVAAITSGMTVDDIAEIDLCYAPPYTPAMDNILTAANIARNKLDGLYTSYTPAEVKEKQKAGNDFILLDVRTPPELEWKSIKGAINIPLGKLREEELTLPKDKEIITFCKISLRGYEAAMILKAKGYNDVKVMDGGILMW